MSNIFTDKWGALDTFSHRKWILLGLTFISVADFKYRSLKVIPVPLQEEYKSKQLSILVAQLHSAGIIFLEK